MTFKSAPPMLKSGMEKAKGYALFGLYGLTAALLLGPEDIRPFGILPFVMAVAGTIGLARR